MNRKNGYRDLKKYRETCNRQQRKYYRETANAENRYKKWTKEEIKLILEHKISDREISKLIMRSMKSIVMKRTKIKKEITNE